MILKDLYELQGGLMENIDYHGHDKPDKMFLATIVELGEFSNEWRGFKYWSKDQEPRITGKTNCQTCSGTGYDKIPTGTDYAFDYSTPCTDCEGYGDTPTNPLLEEYVDVLHFLLEWGIMIGYTPTYIKPRQHIESDKRAVSAMINGVVQELTTMRQLALANSKYGTQEHYELAFAKFLAVGHAVGLTDEQIRTAYIEKNNVNHNRQKTGY